MDLPKMYSILVALVVFVILVKLKSLLIFTPNNTFIKRYKRSQELLKLNKTPLLEEMFKPVASFINTKIKIDEIQRAKLEKDLLRVGETITPEQHQARKIIYPFVMLMIGVILSFASIVIMAVCIMFALLLFFQPDTELERRLRELNANIIKEFPRFARTLRFSPHKNIIHTIEDYLKVCKGPLYYDLKILHAKLEAGMMEKDALQEFSNTIGIIAIQNYIMAVITGIETSKENVDTLYAIQEERIRRMNLDNVKEEMMLRPEKLERNNAIALYSIFAMNAVAVALSFVVDFASQFY
ncbi:hypothetical protein F8154_09860 [Alkaliphilus pronyensis]|uniref:Uncharacterized protein n=1 Tax=Alkaliphilus pronyensis TaxID=1482732 RepID=A0A6I0F413_9FIRM|nr:hypothetical protein [Alkaliphilus pronyensis]KAB3534062.1 hypothetical protein F8154_09860 [Alkaliphilus pronyensis]